MTLQQTGLTKVDENMLSRFPLMTRRGDRQPDRIPGQNLNLSLGNVAPVSPQHETESHDDRDPVQPGRGVEVVPRGEESVAMEVEECTKEDRRDDMKELERVERSSSRVSSERIMAVEGVNNDHKSLTLNISYHR